MEANAFRTMKGAKLNAGLLLREIEPLQIWSDIPDGSTNGSR